MHGFVSQKLGMSDETTSEAIGRRLKALRLGYGLSQQAMGTLLGYTSPRGQAWNNFETGRTKLTMDGFERLLKRFPVPYTWLYRGQMGDLSKAMRDKIAHGERLIEEQEATGKRTRY